MNSNTCSCQHENLPPGDPPDGLAVLEAGVDILATEDRTGLADGVRTGRILALQRLLRQLQGHWLQELAEVDARGVAGAEQGAPAP